MLIAEHIDDEGVVRQTTLELTVEGAVLAGNAGPRALVPVRAVLLAMRKFGRELDPEFVPTGDCLELGDGVTLRMLAFRAIVDAEPKAYLVLEGDGPPTCALSTEVAAALRFLARKPT